MSALEWLLALALVVLAVWVVGAVADTRAGGHLVWRAGQGVRTCAQFLRQLPARIRTDVSRARYRYFQEH